MEILDNVKKIFGTTPVKSSGSNTKISLNQFKSKVTDVARPNRFMVEVYLPEAIKGAFDIKEQEFVSWTVQTAAIPSRAQGEVTIKYHGMELKLPGDYSKQNLSLSFLNDYDQIGRLLFEKWFEFGSQAVSDENTKNYAANSWGASIVLNQIGRTDNSILASYRFYDVIPISISTIDLDMASNDQVEKFTVEFGYSYFENLEIYGR